MQVLPFVFSLILVFFFLTSRLASEERLDKKMLSSCFQVHKNRLGLINKGEACKLRTARKPFARSKMGDPEIKISEPCFRPEGVCDNNHRISLAFFLKKTDELSFQFAKTKLYNVLSAFYKHRISGDLLDEILSCFITQKPKRLCNLVLKSEEAKKQFFNLLADKNYPLEDILVADVYKDNAFCYFFYLRKDIFEKLFQSTQTVTYLEKEYQMRCELKSFVLVKERVLPYLINICPDWTSVYFDQLLCFQSPAKKQIKATVKNQKSEFFYFSTDEVTSQ